MSQTSTSPSMKAEAENIPTYLSPISNPLIEGKTQEKSLKLIKKAVNLERSVRMLSKGADEGVHKSINKKSIGNAAKCLKRGVQEVSKCLRKSNTPGILFLAADVYPVEIIAHLPIICEEKNLLYAFVGSKKSLGMACRSKRATSALLIHPFPKDKIQSSWDDDTKAIFNENDYTTLYNKVTKSIRSQHPYF